MDKFTRQMETWEGKFGKEYTNRNALSLNDMENLYKGRFGITRTEMNSKFIGDFDRDIKILEVGSNVGNQLLCLQKMGFNNLYGIELQGYAVELSKSRTKHINIIKGSAFDIPYKDSYFDLVFTSGVLIHINPSDISMTVKEIYRCAKEYIWGFEYYADKYTDVVYRGNKNLLWKTDFAKLYCEQFSDLGLVREERFKYINNDNIDSMFLLKKEKCKND
ncbi:MAG: methyltransferase domain-containing protein [Deltaproteobacteria bacterium]|nr:methyltransferase domain-containing protein [Deltaproteobacteria bacterium]